MHACIFHVKVYLLTIDKILACNEKKAIPLGHYPSWYCLCVYLSLTVKGHKSNHKQTPFIQCDPCELKDH